jgi:hypothetical protein
MISGEIEDVVHVGQTVKGCDPGQEIHNTSMRWVVGGKRVNAEAAHKLFLRGGKVLCMPEVRGGGCGISKVACDVSGRNLSSFSSVTEILIPLFHRNTRPAITPSRCLSVVS